MNLSEVLINAVHYLLLAANALIGVLVSLRFIHLLQLESYQGRMYWKGVTRHFGRAWAPLFMLSLVGVFLEMSSLYLFSALGSLGHFIFTSAARLLVVLMQLWMYIDWRRAKQKKPLAYTARVKRLLGVVAAIYLLLQFLSLALQPWNGELFAYLVCRSVFVWGALFMPLWVFVAYAAAYPFEKLNNRRYYKQAQRILLQRTDLKKIGITGSYGKTSMKMILGALLSEKYRVLVPQGSINTPMGLSRVIREELDETHEVLLAEMGARYRGDIEELCALVRPDIGVITAVGEQHLETFGSLDNVIKEKFALIESLRAGGAAFFNADNDICRAYYDATQIKARFLYGVESKSPLRMWCEDVTCGCSGSEFVLCSESERVPVKTRLLGRHNILNIVGAAAVAAYMGLDMPQIAEGIKKLTPVQHRLQLIEGAITVIDDAFNSNPAGAKAALEVLASFPGRKIVVTPGMVELGDQEEALNKAFGTQLAQVADIVILVGEARTQPIVDGLTEAGHKASDIHVVASLDKATEKMTELALAGDIVLFENDLPDNY